MLYQLSYFRIAFQYFNYLLLSKKAYFFFSKAGAKVQTFFHSAKLFLQKSHNTLISNTKFFTPTTFLLLQNSLQAPLSTPFSPLLRQLFCSRERNFQSSYAKWGLKAAKDLRRGSTGAVYFLATNFLISFNFRSASMGVRESMSMSSSLSRMSSRVGSSSWMKLSW